MGALFPPRNSLFCQNFGASHKLGFLRRWKTFFFCNVYSRVSVVPIVEDSDYSSSNSESSSESEINVLRENCREFKSIHLCSAVVRLLKTLNWKVAREFCFPSNVERYGFDHSIGAFKMILHVYVCAEMQMEVYALLREIVCYYHTAELDLFRLSYALLDSGSGVERSNFVLSVLIKVFASNKFLDNAIEVLAQARRLGFQPSIRSCNFLLKCLSEANERELLVTAFEEMKNYGPFPNVYTYTIMMKFYCSGQNPVDNEEAINIMEEMETVEISPSVVTYSTFILGLCRVGTVEVAWKFIQDLKRNGQPLNFYCYNIVIHGFVNRDELDKAMLVFYEMESSGVAADLYSYSILIEGFCRCGNVEKGLSLLEEMENSNIRPSIVTYTSILKGLSKSGLMETSLDIFQKIGTSGYEYDERIYNTLITGLCVQGEMGIANKLLEEMINNNLAPNYVTYKSLILGFCKVGSFENASQLFDRLKEAGVKPEPYLWNRVIYECCNEGRVEAALQYIDEMRDLGISPNVYSYSAIIGRLCKEHKSEKALELIPPMLKAYQFPNVVIYGTLVDGYAKQANPRKALMLYTKMLKIGIRPDVIVYTILVNVLCSAGRVDEAYKLFMEMESRGLDPDRICYNSVIAGFCRNKDMKNAWRLFQEMVSRDILPSVVNYTCLIDGFCKISRMDMADMLIDEMKRKNVCPDRVTYFVLIRGCQKLGYMDRVLQLMNEMKNERLNDLCETEESRIIKSTGKSNKGCPKDKISHLTPEEIARIEVGLKKLKLDLWRFFLPYRDPSLLPRQWCIATGTHKSYNLMQTRKLSDIYMNYEEKVANLLLQLGSRHLRNIDNVIEETNSGDNHMDKDDEAYVYEAFLADCCPRTMFLWDFLLACSLGRALIPQARK